MTQRHMLILVFLILAGCTVLNGQAKLAVDGSHGKALHAVVETDVTYGGSTRRTAQEWWSTTRKTYVKSKTRTQIVRHDLGLRWEINPLKGEYFETRTSKDPAPPHGSVTDLRTAGFDYEPKFSWKIKTSRSQTRRFGRGLCSEARDGD
jgi:hypothetical protein